MSNINKNTFSHKLHLEFLPLETLLGVKVVNREILCEDNLYRPIIGFEIGLIFFTFGYGHMFWNKSRE